MWNADRAGGRGALSLWMYARVYVYALVYMWCPIAMNLFWCPWISWCVLLFWTSLCLAQCLTKVVWLYSSFGLPNPFSIQFQICITIHYTYYKKCGWHSQSWSLPIILKARDTVQNPRLKPNSILDHFRGKRPATNLKLKQDLLEIIHHALMRRSYEILVTVAWTHVPISTATCLWKHIDDKEVLTKRKYAIARNGTKFQYLTEKEWW